MVDKVNRGESVEDAPIELKGRWIDAKKAARQVAAHCNAVRGSSVLWVFGIDEKEGVIGADSGELADWISQFNSQFSEVAPSIYDLKVPVDGKTVVALIFGADRAPYVVKNEAGGHIQFEVPWREGCATRSAKRSDLLRLLTPHLQLPTLSPMGAAVTVSTNNGHHAQPEWELNWRVSIEIYIVPKENESFVIPLHDLYLDIMPTSLNIPIPSRPHIYAVHSSEFTGIDSPANSSDSIRSAATEVIVSGPGALAVYANPQTRMLDYDSDLIRLRLRMRAAGYEQSISFECDLPHMLSSSMNNIYRFERGGINLRCWSKNWVSRSIEDFD